MRQNKYIIIAEKEGHENIYLAVDTQTNRRVVIKEVTLEIKSKYKTEKDIREIRALDRVYMNLDSIKRKYGLDNVIELIEYWTDGKVKGKPNLPTTLYQVTKEAEYTLNEYVKNEGPDLEKIIDHFIHLCTGLERLHEQIVHRDIKPKNILIDDNKAKFSDMGSACGKEGKSTASLPGTTWYKAPDINMSKKSDIFSLGVTLFEIINNVEASKTIYDTDCATNKSRELNANPIFNLVNTDRLFNYDEEDEITEGDKDRVKVLANARKEIIEYYLKIMPEECRNEYIKEIIKKAMNPEAEIDLIYPDKNVRYQTAREMKTDLIITQRHDRFDTLAEKFNNLKTAVEAIAGKIKKGETNYNTLHITQIINAYEEKKKFCNELLRDVGQTYEITKDDLTNSHLLRMYTDNKVMLIFEKSLEYIFGKNPGLDILRFAQASPSAKTKEEVDAEKRAYYAEHGAAKINQLTDDEKMSFANWKAKLLDLKRKCDLSIQV